MWRTSTYITILVGAIVSAAMLYSNVEYRDGVGAGNNWAVTYSHSQGWPIPYRTFAIQETYYTTTGAIQDRTIFDSSYRPTGILVDLIVFCAIAIGVIFACNAQLRNKGHWQQFTLGNVIFLLTFVSVLTYVYTDGIWAATALAELFDEEPNTFWYLSFHPWYIVGPLSFGVTCVAWAIGCLALRILHQFSTPVAYTRQSKGVRSFSMKRVIFAVGVVVLIFGSLISFPADIPWMSFIWLVLSLIANANRKPMWPWFAGCVLIIAIKRPGYTAEFWILTILFVVVAFLDWRALRRKHETF